jgi:hypothetical protein
MKHFAVFLLFAGLIPWIPCKAEDGSVQGDKEYPSLRVVSKPRPAQRTVSTHRTRRVALAHKERAGFCRDFYCVHAAGTPWWPGAPGD